NRGQGSESAGHQAFAEGMIGNPGWIPILEQRLHLCCWGFMSGPCTERRRPMALPRFAFILALPLAATVVFAQQPPQPPTDEPAPPAQQPQPDPPASQAQPENPAGT